MLTTFTLIFKKIARHFLSVAVMFSSGMVTITSAQKISAGNSHSLLVCPDGTVKAWGYNGYGQLGSDPNITSSSNVPLVVSGLSGTITAVSAGGSHSLALKSDGSVWAWGYNDQGQLGDNSTNSTYIPVQVLGLSGVVAISAGQYYSMALKSNGTVWSWGYNGYGQLGDSTYNGSLVPVATYTTLTNVIAISAGNDHSMALRNDSTVWTWGSNYDGQLGLGTNYDSIYPCKIPGLIKVAWIDAGNTHSLAVKSNGLAYSWGSNGYGQLGDGTTNPSSSPIQVIGLTNIKKISAGGTHSVALKGDSTLWKWGADLPNAYRLAHKNSGPQPTPQSNLVTKVQGVSGVSAVSAGADHVAFMKSNQTAWAWGNGGNGQLGHAEFNDSEYPVQTHCICSSLFPSVTASADVTICPGFSTTLTGTATGGNGGPYSYQWSPSVNINCTSCANAVVNPYSPTSYTVVGLDKKLCHSAGEEVIVNTLPAPANPILTPAPFPTVCNGNPVSLTASNTDVSYYWMPGGSTASTIVVTPTNNTYYKLVTTGANGCTATDSLEVNLIKANLYPYNPNCFQCNGAIYTGATGGYIGGTFSYQYSWSNATTNSYIDFLCSNNYSLTVTDDNGCSATESVMLLDGGPIVLPALTKTDVTCNGSADGTATANPSGGGDYYYYNWSNGSQDQTASGLIPGTYTVIITDGGSCGYADTGIVTITEPAVLTASAPSSTNVSCNGGNNGSATAAGSGGTAPYTYLWMPGGQTTQTAVNLTAGVYTVTVKDANNCSATPVTKTITQPLALSVTIPTSTNVSCSGGNNGSAAANVTGGTGTYTYLWFPGGQATQSVSNLTATTYTVTVKDANNCPAAPVTKIITQPAAISASVAVTDATCSGACNGTATVSSAGGTGLYTYLWSPGGQTTSSASSLCASTYTVVVKDANNCSTTLNTFVFQPNALAVSVSNADLACNGICNGSSAATASGGTTPYSYNWSGGQTTSAAAGLCATSYTVTITDANGCTKSENTTLTQPAALTSTASATNVLCNNACDGTATGSASGGTSPYTYTWNPGNIILQSISGLCPATYSLATTDANGCNATLTSVTITQPAVLTTSVTKTDANCNGTCTGSATVTPAGGSGPFTYLWLPSSDATQTAPFLCAGTHTVIISDSNNCMASDTISVSQPLGVPVTATATPTSCGSKNGSAVASVSGPGAIPPFSYLWTTGSTGTSITGLDAGIYRANVTDGNGCFGFADALVTSTNGPSITSFSVTAVSCFGLSNGAIDISISGGSLPYTYFWSNGQTTQDASGLSTGPHEIKVADASGCVIVKSIPVNQPAQISLNAITIPSGCSATNGSAAVTVNGGTSPYTYLWTAGGTSSAKTALGAGVYEVEVTDSKGCFDSTLIAVQDSGGPIVSVDTIVGVSCGGSGFVLLVPQDSAAIGSYQWSSGNTTQNLNNAAPGNYGVVITDTSGCKSVLITPVNPVLPPIKPICLVTVDTLTNQNIIVWEKPVSTFVSGFNIYRESSQQGLYQKIAFSPYSNQSTYYDSIADPNTKWARYRISMVDICGTEGPVSPDHKTMHLSISSAAVNSTTLIWDSYVGYSFAYYNIFRKDSANGIWTLIGAMPASFNTYTDGTFPHTGGTIYYHVDVDHPGGDCIATIKNPMEPQATSVKSGKSNSSDRTTIPPAAVNELSADNRVAVYPSPNNGLFTVELKNISSQEIKIFNMLGEEVKTIGTTNGKNKIEVDLRKQGEGLYYIRVSSEQNVITKKVVIK